MVNPFCDSSKVNILREAFPSVRISLIEDKLLSVDGDVNRAFELLLEMTDPSQSAANGPPLPDRPLHTVSSCTFFFYPETKKILT